MNAAEKDRAWGSVAESLSRGWPLYWRLSGMSVEEFRADLEGARARQVPSLAFWCRRHGLAMIVASRRVTWMMDETEFGAAAAAAGAGDLGDYIIQYGILGARPETESFAWLHGIARDRSHHEAFMKMTGAADWCLSMGWPLESGNDTELRLAEDDVPSPSAVTPPMLDVVVRMSLTAEHWRAPTSGQSGLELVARLLPDALRIREMFVLPTILEGKEPSIEEDVSIVSQALSSLQAAQYAGASIRQAAAREGLELGDDVVAVTLLRFLAQDVFMVLLSGSSDYAELPVLDAEAVTGLTTEDADIASWIAKQAPG